MKTWIADILRGGRLFGPEMREDRYAVYDELRRSDPVHRDEAVGAWILTRHDDVALVLNDPRFSSRRVERVRDRFDEGLQPLLGVLAGRMSEYDGAPHRRVRSLVHDAFIRTEVEKWEPFVRRRIEDLLDEPLRTGRCEFMADVAIPLPLSVILDLVGIPAEERDRVKVWSDEFSKVALGFFAGLPEDQLRRGLEAVTEFREFLRERVSIVERSPGNDLLSSLVAVQHEKDRLSVDELLSNVLLLLAAGNETTTCLLGSGLAALLRHPEQLALIREDPSLLPNAVEELLRFDAPVQFLGRVATEDVELRGAEVSRGDVIVAVIASANRDPEWHDEPDRLDVRRPRVQHLSFGHGQHFCVGAQLARLEARVVFEVLFERCRELRIDTTGSLTHLDNPAIRCLQSLPLRIR